MHLRPILFLLLLLPLFSSSASAQKAPPAPAGTTLDFCVVDGDGWPVPFAGIYLERRRSKIYDWEEADHAGTCRFEEVSPPEKASVLVKAHGFAMARFHLDELPRSDGAFLLRLEPERIITGRVLDAAGRPAAGARLRIRGTIELPNTRTRPDGYASTLEEVVSGERFRVGPDGAFLLDGLYPGAFHVSVLPPNAHPAECFPADIPLITVPLEAGSRDRVITLGKGAWVPLQKIRIQGEVRGLSADRLSRLVPELSVFDSEGRRIQDFRVHDGKFSFQVSVFPDRPISLEAIVDRFPWKSSSPFILLRAALDPPFPAQESAHVVLRPFPTVFTVSNPDPSDYSRVWVRRKTEGRAEDEEDPFGGDSLWEDTQFGFAFLKGVATRTLIGLPPGEYEITFTDFDDQEIGRKTILLK